MKFRVGVGDDTMTMSAKRSDLNFSASEFSDEDLEYLVYRKELMRRREMRGRRH